MSIHPVNVRSWNSGSNYVREDKVLILINLAQSGLPQTNRPLTACQRKKVKFYVFSAYPTTNSSRFKWRHDRKTSPAFANTLCYDISSVVGVIFRNKYNTIKQQASQKCVTDWVTPFSRVLCEKLIVSNCSRRSAFSATGRFIAVFTTACHFYPASN